MLKETFALIVSGVGLGFAVVAVQNKIVWIAAIGFIAFFVGLRFAIGVLVDRKINESIEKKTKQSP